MKRAINNYDFYSENFENYFKDIVVGMTQIQKDSLPEQLLFKLFSGEKLTHGNLSFKEKVYILNTVFRKKVEIVIEDENDGISLEDYCLAKKAQAGKRTNTELLSEPRVQASFVLADRDFFKSIAYFNQIFTTEIYKLYKRTFDFDRTQKDINYNKGREVVKHITELILSYEINKKRFVMTNNLNPGKLYALIYFSTGEKLGSSFIKKDFKYSYNCNAVMLSKAVKELTDTGYLDRRGGTTKYRYTLTAKGQHILNRVIEQIIDNYKKTTF